MSYFINIAVNPRKMLMARLVYAVLLMPFLLVNMAHALTLKSGQVIGSDGNI